MISNFLQRLRKRKSALATAEEWGEAQATNLRWYTERMFKPKINAWDSLLDFFAGRLEQEGKVLLEVGPGPTGGLLKFMTGRQKIGVEPLAQDFADKGFLNIPRGDILFLNGLGESIPLVDESVDIALCIHSLGHAQHPFKILEVLDFLRTDAQTTSDHPVALSEADLDRWFQGGGYSLLDKDVSGTTRENELLLPVYNAVFVKSAGRKTYPQKIDFSISKFDIALHGGWYAYESEGERPARWVSDTFQAFLGRTGDEKTLFLDAYAVVDHFPGKTLTVSMEVDGVDLGQREVRQTGLATLSWELPPGKAGNLRILGRCDHFFVPDQVGGTGDDRELSLLVFRLGVE